LFIGGEGSREKRPRGGAPLFQRSEKLGEGHKKIVQKREQRGMQGKRKGKEERADINEKRRETRDGEKGADSCRKGRDPLNRRMGRCPKPKGRPGDAGAGKAFRPGNRH